MVTKAGVSPAVSVCIPTYRRLELLKRAVESVLAQTFQDWELLISDDEEPAGETWTYLEQLRLRDARIRVMRNTGEHGQAGNMNNLLLSAGAPWIKPLFDDDVLKPECLEIFLRSVRGLEDVALVSCLTELYRSGKRIGSSTRIGRSELHFTPQRYVHLGMYLNDCPGRTPTQVMVKRDAIHAGALFENPAGIYCAIDAWWSCKVGRFGGVLHINRVLTEFHQGAHETYSSRTPDDVLDREYALLRAEQLKWIDPQLNPPALPVATGMVDGIRVIRYLKLGQFTAALKLAARVRYLRSWFLALRWTLNQAFPGRFPAVPHQEVRLRAEKFTNAVVQATEI